MLATSGAYILSEDSALLLEIQPPSNGRDKHQMSSFLYRYRKSHMHTFILEGLKNIYACTYP